MCLICVRISGAQSLWVGGWVGGWWAKKPISTYYETHMRLYDVTHVRTHLSRGLEA